MIPGSIPGAAPFYAPCVNLILQSLSPCEGARVAPFSSWKRCPPIGEDRLTMRPLIRDDLRRGLVAGVGCVGLGVEARGPILATPCPNPADLFQRAVGCVGAETGDPLKAMLRIGRWQPEGRLSKRSDKN